MKSFKKTGVDISVDKISIVSIEQNDTRVTLRKVYNYPIIKDYFQADHEEFYSQIRKIINKNSNWLSVSDQIGISIPDPWVIHRLFKYSFEEYKICHSVPVEIIEKYVSHDLANTYHAILPYKFDKEQVSIVLVAIVKDLIDQTLEIMRAANIHPDFISVRHFAIINIIRESLASEKCHIIHMDEGTGFLSSLELGFPRYFVARPYHGITKNDIRHTIENAYHRNKRFGGKFYLSGKLCRNSRILQNLTTKHPDFFEFLPLRIKNIHALDKKTRNIIFDNLFALGLSLINPECNQLNLMPKPI